VITPRAPASIIDLSFPHHWRAEILSARPLILPPRHYVYPQQVEEIERGALEVLVKPMADDETVSVQQFLATCALGFRDSAVPSGVWTCPNPGELCAVAGGYAYLIDTTAPEQFTMIPYRPVLEVRALRAAGLLLFVEHRSILAWGAEGQAWESGKLSDEGITALRVENGILHGRGWQMATDEEMPFSLDLTSGKTAGF
jgi:hypothetical protein